LGARGVIEGVVVDTAFSRGNYPESCSIEGTDTDDVADAEWHTILPQSKLQGDCENVFAVGAAYAFTHLRFNIFPDGGVARLRVHGRAVPDWHRIGGLESEVDLAAVENGSEVLACSDMFFGRKDNLIMPGRALNISDGWETRRRRGPGHDWVVVQLATEGVVHRVEIDTNHFKGNYPDTASIDGSIDGEAWTTVLPRTKLEAHTRHFFVDAVAARGPFMQLRLNVYPDGGVSRLRVWGKATENGCRAAAVRHVNTLANPERELRSCCGSSKWVEAMANARPFGDWNAMIDTANGIDLSPEDWQEGFRAHPRIGDRVAKRWPADEQSGTHGAPEETMNALAEANQAYEQKFGHVFLICATGRSADEMLASLRQRMNNDAAPELRVAAGEQRKINALRLEKLVL
ncbi:MAG TPA: allantoicase, partial [Thermoanaerobaculia bacterium]|nr:allantoicase [Thermoanaerobaculia bacterium]